MLSRYIFLLLLFDGISGAAAAETWVPVETNDMLPDELKDKGFNIMKDLVYDYSRSWYL